MYDVLVRLLNDCFIVNLIVVTPKITVVSCSLNSMIDMSEGYYIEIKEHKVAGKEDEMK